MELSAITGLPYISIHAPPRGATCMFGHRLQLPSNFNSRPSARGDPPGSSYIRKTAYFNSRPSARGDLMRCQSMRGFFISIHAPPRGATLVDGAVNERIYISIHAPPRGATGVRVQRITKIKVISIHAPPRGATRFLGDGTALPCHFNSRPSARGDYGNQ